MRNTSAQCDLEYISQHYMDLDLYLYFPSLLRAALISVFLIPKSVESIPSDCSESLILITSIENNQTAAYSCCSVHSIPLSLFLCLSFSLRKILYWISQQLQLINKVYLIDIDLSDI